MPHYRDKNPLSFNSSAASCGILELSDFGNHHNSTLYAIASYLYHPSRGRATAFAMWSDVKEGNGEKFAEFLSKRPENLAKLTTTSFAENPKTSNLIKVYVWEIPHEKLREWYKEEKLARYERTI